MINYTLTQSETGRIAQKWAKTKKEAWRDALDDCIWVMLELSRHEKCSRNEHGGAIKGY